MTVEKSISESYTIHSKGEYARIVIVEWAPRDIGHARPSYGGELLVHSSFGAFCNSWGACANPFKQFLIGLDRHYFMTKCRPGAAEEFDGEKSLQHVKEWLIDKRKGGDFTRGDTREAWNSIMDARDEIVHSEYAFVTVLQSLEIEGLDEPWHFSCRSLTAECVGFWRDLWPEFVAAVKAEQQQPIAA
jgi:hypothetical protein